MSVIIVTGQPGSGKTALTVDMLANDPQFKGRPIFAMGIPDLKLPHIPCPPVEEWTETRQDKDDPTLELPYFTFPENALVVIDEAQRVYRPRPPGSKVPQEVAAFETHRHTGVDFILLTQHAGLLDSNIRKLVGRHIHIRVTPLGRYRYEWTELGDPESNSSRELAARSKFTLPKRSFDLYKSSELHTKIKVRMPAFVYVFGVALLSTIALGYYAYTRVDARVNPVASVEKKDTVEHQNGKQGIKTAGLSGYLEERQPRLAGLAHTAPVYDEITKPVDAPYPTGCMATSKRCRCTDQQGNDYVTTDAICRQIVEHGMFKDWGQREPGPVGTATAQPVTAPRPDKPEPPAA